MQITIRQIKYLNNIVEQDHRGIKRITNPMMGFKAFYSAKATIAGIELYRMEGAHGLAKRVRRPARSRSAGCFVEMGAVAPMETK